MQLPRPVIDMSVTDLATLGLEEIPGEFRAAWRIEKASGSNSDGQSIPVIDLADLRGEKRSSIVEQLKRLQKSGDFSKYVMNCLLFPFDSNFHSLSFITYSHYFFTYCKVIRILDCITSPLNTYVFRFC
jgi:hypothetical protein